MTWNSVMGLISTVALFRPVLLILTFRLGSYRTFPALAGYYTIVFCYNLMTEGYIKASPDTIRYWSICNNLLDAPLMLFFLSYFSTSATLTKKIKISIFCIIGFEITIVLLKGLSTDAITITLGPSLLTVVSFCAYFFIRQTKITIMHHKATGKAIIAAALLFGYGCYTIIYLMYYVFKTPFVEDTFLVYFLVATFSSLLLCAGLVIERKRVQKLNELLQTRKELSAIYKDTKMAAPLRTAMLDFDKDQWN
ncbi:MAG: hypothetical protein ABI688_09430 [Bacteroidota bacterium]